MRLLLVVTLTTLCGGSFGAAVGGLLGYAAPSGLDAMFNINTHHNAIADEQRMADSIEAQRTDASIALTPRQPQEGVAAYGAALGGAWGLVLGAIVGLGLGVLDQIIVAVLAGLGIVRNRNMQTQEAGR